MDFHELQEKMIANLIDYGNRHNIKIDADFAILKLHEEVGELTQSILIYKRKSRPEKFTSKEKAKQQVANELADVIGMTIVNAYLLGIDLEKTIQSKWIKNKKK